MDLRRKCGGPPVRSNRGEEIRSGGERTTEESVVPVGKKYYGGAGKAAVEESELEENPLRDETDTDAIPRLEVENDVDETTGPKTPDKLGGHHRGVASCYSPGGTWIAQVCNHLLGKL
ncbi:hypothetical protein NDU88_007567 [Pleurodeles waltl]|uniref:Uncharacterized protein n=1 Tax=Pleurodeles waltl TaxID=8319 RepID=A0AAV7U0R1_PLEWA|nr:hypothetical protein NDU88_007567 [Pleurodeles waltl]